MVGLNIEDGEEEALLLPIDLVPLVSSTFWVEVHDLPLGFFLETVAKQLGNFIGRFLEYDLKQLNRGLMNHLKIQVELDVRKPLKRRKKIVLPLSKFTYVNFHEMSQINLEHDFKDDTIENVEGKKRPRIDVSVPNVSEFSDSLGILAEQHNAHLHQILTIANGQADREP
ncbi:hypothetical protein Gotur_001805 [Gossypium turneri]